MGLFGPGKEYKAKISKIETDIENLKELDMHSDEYGTLFKEVEGKIRELKPKDQLTYLNKLGL